MVTLLVVLVIMGTICALCDPLMRDWDDLPEVELQRGKERSMDDEALRAGLHAAIMSEFDGWFAVVQAQADEAEASNIGKYTDKTA